MEKQWDNEEGAAASAVNNHELGAWAVLTNYRKLSSPPLGRMEILPNFDRVVETST